MCDFNTENRNKAFEIDLLSKPKVTQEWIPQFLRREYCWKVLSGKWESESPNKIIYRNEPKVKTGENVAIIGSPRWNDFTLQMRFRLLTDSRKPPEGGAILYFLFHNIKNYYSVHFCLFKQKIEFIKRLRGHWTIMVEQYYNFKKQQEYFISLKTKSGFHNCQINGSNLIEIYDKDILNGCVAVGAKYCDVEFSHLLVKIP